MNFFRDPLVEFFISISVSTILSVISLIVSIKALPKKDKQPSRTIVQRRVHTLKGFLYNLALVFVLMIGVLYLVLQALIATQSHAYPDSSVVLVFCGIGIVACLFLMLLALLRIIRGTPATSVTSMQEQDDMQQHY